MSDDRIPAPEALGSETGRAEPRGLPRSLLAAILPPAGGYFLQLFLGSQISPFA